MGKCEKWTIAYRLRKDGATILDDVQTAFTPIPNTWRYWRADPFLFEKDGKTYLFAEFYDRARLRGILGCCELTDDGAGEWKIILEEPFHLSYPFVYRDGEEIYMIPESCRAGKIFLYRATQFPYQWERVRELADLVAADSTVVDGTDGKYLITLRTNGQSTQLLAAEMADGRLKGSMRSICEPDDLQVRPAGRLFCWRDCRIRPAQDCSAGYGWGLNFMQVTQLDRSGYAEHLLKKIRPEDITIRGIQVPCGIHTYNLTDRYEVIDFKQIEFGLVSKIAGVIRRIKRMLHRT
jgi:hypothetical protein